MTTLTTAKKLMKDFIVGTELTPPAELMDFVIDNSLNTHDLIPDSLVQKALDRKFIHAPKTMDKDDKRSALERTLEYRKDRIAKAESMKLEADNLFKMIGEKASATPPVLFRLTWKDGKKGFDVLHIYPLSDKEEHMFIVAQLTYNKEFKCLIQTNIMDALYAVNLKFENGIFQVYNNGGEWMPAEVSYPVPTEKEEKPKTAKRVTPKKPKAETAPVIELAKDEEKGK